MGFVLGVCAVLRNEADNLPAVFQVLEQLERFPEVDQIAYSFYENDSVDHSVSLLIDWLRGERTPVSLRFLECLIGVQRNASVPSFLLLQGMRRCAG